MAYYTEVDHYQVFKNRQLCGGDVFTSTRLPEEGRVVSALADGLGSGVKANVLATLTTTMATKFVCSDLDITKAAGIIMETLPICSVRKIGYSTFTIVDLENNGLTRIIEHDNPGYFLLREGKTVEVEKEMLELKSYNNRPTWLKYSCFVLEPEDRIIFFSDGVTQAGMGKRATPLGWGEQALSDFIEKMVQHKHDISARDLARVIVNTALDHDNFKAADDITCGVIYFREPRQTLLVSGPPYAKERDGELAERVKNFKGRKIISGGTTANIIARELGLSLKVNLEEVKFTGNVPPSAGMEGVDLVTEGTITLSEVVKLLEEEGESKPNAAQKLVSFLLNSDIITIIVGTRINEAHQDPNLPQELEIRRNLMKKLRKILEKKYLKETELIFI